MNELIENTPFRIIGDEERGYALTIGPYIVTPWATREETEKRATTPDYNVILNIVTLIVEVGKDNQKRNLKSV